MNTKTVLRIAFILLMLASIAITIYNAMPANLYTITLDANTISIAHAGSDNQCWLLVVSIGGIDLITGY